MKGFLPVLSLTILLEFCLIVTFKSKEDQDIYQDDPTHLKFIENASYLWDKVKVYDSMEFS